MTDAMSEEMFDEIRKKEKELRLSPTLPSTYGEYLKGVCGDGEKG